MTDQNTPPADQSEVLKSDLPGILSAQAETGLDGEFLWPISPLTLALLYRSSAEHSRSIHLKAESAYGGGLQGKHAEWLEEVCEGGLEELFVGLGLDLETYGNAFMQVILSRDGERVLSLRRLPAITMTRFRDGFLQRVRLPNGDDKKYTFTKDEIIHLREPCPMGRRYSFPTWIGAEGMLELAHAATRYNAAFFKNNAMPEYAVIFKGITPSKEQKTAIGEFFRNEYKGIDNAHRTLVLHGPEEGEVKIEKLTADIKDADFLKLIDAARDRIPVAHGVPPRMLGIMSAGQLGGGGEVSGQLFTFEHLTLKPKRRRMLGHVRPVLIKLGLRPGVIEDGLEDDQVAFRPLDLTPPKDDVDGLPDLVSTGIVSPEEARVLLPFLQEIQVTRSEGAGRAITRTANPDALDRLTALLGKL